MKNLIIVLIALFVSINLNAHDHDVLRGKILIKGDDNKVTPVHRAKVYWEVHPETGVLTDKDGAFQLERHDHDVVLFVSYIGYDTQSFLIDLSENDIEIELTPTFQLEELRVQGSKPGTIINRSDVQKSEEITMQGLRKAACCNLSEAFETNASVDVNFTDAVTGAKQIQLLGLDGIYTQIMYEKIPFATGLASKFGMAYIPGSWMESIQISKGTATVQNGFESITGQINVEYKKPFNDEKLHVNLFADSHERFEANINSSYEINHKLASTFLAHASYSETEMDENKDGFLDSPLFEMLNLMNRWEYNGHNFETRFGFKFLNENRKSGQMGYNSLKDNDGLYGIGIENRRYEVFFKPGYVFPTQTFHSIGLITNASLHQQRAFYGNRTYNADQTSIYGNLIYESGQNYDPILNRDVHSYNFGLSYKFDRYDETFDSEIMLRDEIVPGVFTEYTYGGVENLTVTGGLRADFHNLYGTFITPRLNVRYEFPNTSVIRASGGKGYKMPNIYAENPGLIATSREFVVVEELNPVESWNYGVNYSTDLLLFSQLIDFNIEYFRTDFVNQIIIDLENSPRNVLFYNLDGKSYSNSFQIDATYSPVTGFDIMTAYRLNDVWETIDGQLREKRLISKHKGFLNLMYSTPSNSWSFDVTGVYNGGGKLPDTHLNPEEYRLGDKFPAYFTMLAQVTKRFGEFEIYLGGENLTNYKQKNPILGASDPFGEFFDSSLIWGPISGRKLYMGARWTM